MFLTGFIMGLIIGGSIYAISFIRDYRLIDRSYKEAKMSHEKETNQND
jgi:hypothetical protein